MIDPAVIEGLRASHYELSTESRLAWAGLKGAPDTAAIAARYAWLYTLDRVADLGRQVAAAPPGQAQRRARRVYDCLLDGYLHAQVAPLVDRLTAAKIGATVTVAGEAIPYYTASARIGREPDPARREALAAACAQVVEGLQPRALELLAATLDALERATGSRDYVAHCAGRKGVDYAAFTERAQRFQAATDAVYTERLGALLHQALGAAIGQAPSCHARYLLSPTKYGARFPADTLVASVDRWLSDVGLGLAGFPNVHLDVEDRPAKNPRACCFGPDIPGEVHLLVRPVGGWADYSALLHEAGHALHFAATDPALPFADRQLAASNALTETYAFLLQFLLLEPAWLRRYLGFTVDEAAAVAGRVRLHELFLIRRYVGKLLYELRLYAAPMDSPRNALLYAQSLGRSTGFAYPPAYFLDDVDAGLYAADYLRAWFAHAQLAGAFRQQLGQDWWSRPEAGARLRGLWHEGSRPDCEEVVARFGLPAWDPRPLADLLTA